MWLLTSLLYLCSSHPSLLPLLASQRTCPRLFSGPHTPLLIKLSHMLDIFMKHPLQLFLITEIWLFPQGYCLLWSPLKWRTFILLQCKYQKGQRQCWVLAFFWLLDTISKSLFVCFFLLNTKAKPFPPLRSVPFGSATHSLWCCNLRLLGMYICTYR